MRDTRVSRRLTRAWPGPLIIVTDVPPESRPDCTLVELLR